MGRDSEIRDVSESITSAPVTTLLGPGGVGKTALAITVAAACAPDFPGGVTVVWLGSLRSADLVAAEVAAQLGLPRSGGQSYEDALTRWLTGVPEDKKAALIPAGWFDAWADATWATDPVGATQSPPVIRAPNGVLADSADTWSANKPYYDPAKITVPTLLVQAEWDQDLPPYMAQTLFPLLVNSPGKRYVLLAEGTHSIIMEKNRLELFKAVQAFLDEGGGS